MPIYSIQGPDGNTYSIEGPAGASRADVIQAIQRQMAQQRAQEVVAAPQVAPPPAAPSTQRTIGEAILDIPAAGLSGLGGLLQFPGQLVKLVPGLSGLGEVLEKPGELVSGAGDYLKSEGLKARQALQSKAISDAEKDGILSQFATAITSTIKDPALLTTFVAEQVPLLLGPLSAAKVAQKIGAKSIESAGAGLTGKAAEEAVRVAAQRVNKKAATAAYGTGSAMQAADVSSDAYDQAYKQAIEQGLSEDEALRVAANAGRVAGAGAGVVSLLAQRLPGAMAIEKRLAGVPGTQGRIASGFGEALGESLEEGGGQLFKNLGLRQVNPEQPLLEGVGGAAGLGALGGGLLGTALGRKAEEPRFEGQQEGESDRQFAARLQQEIAAGIRPPAPPAPPPQEPPKVVLPGDQQLFTLAAQPNGYGMLENLKQRLIQNASIPEDQKKPVIDNIRSIQERMNIEAAQRQQPTTMITEKDLLDLGFTQTEAQQDGGIVSAIRGKDLGDQAQSTEVFNTLNAALADPNLPQDQRAKLEGTYINLSEFRQNLFPEGQDAGIPQMFEPPKPAELTVEPVAEAPAAPAAPAPAAPAAPATTPTVFAAPPPEKVLKIEGPKPRAMPVRAKELPQPPAPVTQEQKDIKSKVAEIERDIRKEEIKRRSVIYRSDSLFKFLKNKLNQTEVNDVSTERQFKPLVRKDRRGDSISTFVANGDLDPWLPPDRRLGMNNYDEYDNTEYIKDLLRGGKATDLTFDAKSEVERIYESITALERSIKDLMSVVEANEAANTAREEQRGVAEETGPTAAEVEDQGVAPEPILDEEGRIVRKSLAKVTQGVPPGKFRELERRAKAAPEPKVEEPKAEEPKPEEPKAEEPKPTISPEIQKKIETLGRVLQKNLAKFGLKGIDLNLEQGMADEGSFSGQLIRIALDAQDPLGILRHESIHALKEANFFTDKQWATLERMADQQWIDQYLKGQQVDYEGQVMSRYDAYMKEYAGNMALIREEAIADAFRNFSKKQPAGLMGALTTRMKNFFKAVKSAFNSQGFESAEDIFGKIEEGKLEAAAPVKITEAERKSLRGAEPEDLKNSLSEMRISPRYPTAAKATEDPMGDVRLQPDLNTFKQNRQSFIFNVGLMNRYPNFRGMRGSADDRVEQMILQMQDNLTWLYNHWKPNFRERSRLWYVGGNRISHRWAKRYDMPPEKVAGVIAALSPQKGWFANVSIAERMLDAVVNNADTKWDDSMSDVLRSREWGNKLSKVLKYSPVEQLARFEGKTLREIYRPGDQASLLDMAVWIRAWDEAKNPQVSRVITPEGRFTNDLEMTEDGSRPMPLRAQGFGPMTRALMVLQARNREDISLAIGDFDKVRSFYNNIISPYNNDDVTIDTHAVAAALLRPLGSSDLEVSHNFGSAPEDKSERAMSNSSITGLHGSYSVYAEAYRRAARDLGVLPRELQSITWEAVRGLFRPGQKVGAKERANQIWRQVASGAINANEARREISKLVGGIEDPAWTRSPVGSNEAARDSSYQGKLPGVGQPGRPEGRGGELPAGTQVERKSLRSRPFVDPATEARIDATIIAAPRESLVDRMIDAISPKTFSRLREEFIVTYNELAEVDKRVAAQIRAAGGKEQLADERAESAALLSDQAAAVASSALGAHNRKGGIPVYRNGIVTVDTSGDNEGPVVIFAPLASTGDPKTFRDYQFWASVNRSKKYMLNPGQTRYVEQVFEKDDIDRAEQLRRDYAAQGIDFNDIRSRWLKYNNGLVKLMRDTGGLSERAARDFVEHADYFPFYRQINEEDMAGPKAFSTIAGTKPPKAAKGGEAPLGDFFETVVRNTQAAITLAMKNVAAQRATSQALRINEVVRLSESPQIVQTSATTWDVMDSQYIDTVSAADQAAAEAIARRKFGPTVTVSASTRAGDWNVFKAVKIGDVDAADAQEARKLAYDNHKYRPDINVYKVLEHGQPVYYRAADIKFINAIKALNMADLPFIGLLSAPSNLLRTLVTKDPGYMLVNQMRDSLSAWQTSGVKMTPFIDSARQFAKSVAKTSPEMEALFNAGVIGGYEYAHGQRESGKFLEKEIRRKAGVKSVTEKITTPFTSLWGALERGTQVSDGATRAEVYKRVLAETGNEAEAIWQAAEVLNFYRHGRNPIIRVLTAAVPFLNSRIQGLDVLYRAGMRPAFDKMATDEQRKRMKTFWVRGMTMFATTFMYWLLTHDDDEYKKQEQETRDNYWLIPSLGIKIAIPFEVGVIFKVLPERLFQSLAGNDTAKDTMDSLKRQLESTLMFSIIPQAVAPYIEVTRNFSSFTQRPIIGQGLENVAPRFQVAPGTSSFAQVVANTLQIETTADSSAFTKGLSKSLEISPVKLDHLIKGYTGTLGQYAVEVFDAIYNLNADVPKPSKRFEQLPVIKRLALDPNARGNVTAYYDLKNAVDEVVRTSNLLERTMNYDAYAPYLRANIGLLANKQYISALEKSMKEFREMKILIRNSKMDSNAKEKAILAVEQMENQLTSNIQQVKVAANR